MTLRWRRPFFRMLAKQKRQISLLVLAVMCVSVTSAQQNTSLPENIVVKIHELSSSPLSAASSSQILLYDSRSFDQEGRFQLEAGRHTFCLSGGGGVYASFKLTSSTGEFIVSRLNKKGCVTVDLPAGITSVRLVKVGPRKVSVDVTASVSVDPSASVAPVPLVTGSNVPVGGFWALQDITQSSGVTFANRVASQTPLPGSETTPAEIYLVNDSVFDDLSLWQLPDGTGNQNPALLGPIPNYWSIWFNELYVVSSCGDYCGNAYGDPNGIFRTPPGVQINDQGNYQFTFELNNLGGLATTNGTNVLNVVFQKPGDAFKVIFRFFPDGTKIGVLQPGEVALYQSCNQQGKAAVFIPLLGAGVVSPSYSLTGLTSQATTLNNTAKSIAVGSGSSVYWGTSSSNIQGAVASNTACLNNSPTGLLFVEPLVYTLTVAHDKLGKNCANCSLEGATLNLTAGSDVANFSGWNFSGADFSHATISNLNLSNANLTNAKFNGATLSNINLNGVQLGNGPLDFSGATLTNVTFAGVDITGFNFTGATLNNINLSSSQVIGGTGLNFTDATLNQVNLNGLDATKSSFGKTTLCGVSLVGTDRFHRLDLTSGNFLGTEVTLSNECAANLSYTIFTPSPSTSTQWNGINLTGAVLKTTTPNLVLSSQTNPLQLAGATLIGASLQGVVLDYAQGLANQTLTGADFNNSSLRFTNLSNATLYGAQFNGANLEGANMGGVLLTEAPSSSDGAAQLVGAFLRNVNLSQSRLSGANFSNANFYSKGAVGTKFCTPGEDGFTPDCATAAGSLMDGTNFSGAYLFGVDFTSITGPGVNFTGAVLTGANLASAKIGVSSSGATPSFSGALLQGTNMSSMMTENEININLTNAYVDFTAGGNTINLVLSGHTSFAGYWGKPGEQVCAYMVYDGATTVPETYQGTACPSGSGQNGCGPASADGSNLLWKSGTDITTFASYVNNSTYTTKPASGNQICNFDPLWVPLNIEETGPNTPHPPQAPKPPSLPKPPTLPRSPSPPRLP